MNLLACAHATVVLKTGERGAWWACRDCETPFAPVAPVKAVDAPAVPEYLSVRQLAQQIPYSEGQIRNMMSQGVFRRGVHYDKPTGGRVSFRWAAVQAWMRGEKKSA